jgi:acetyltransferase-like isoleucine patch superfamily enzyme
VTDPRQARFLTVASLRWVLRHRAWTPWYLVRYWRLLRMRERHRDVVTEGMVFLGRRVEIAARPGYGRVVLGRWVHVGDETRLRAHEGTLRIGDKVVFGRGDTVNCYLDVEVGARTLVADWVYITDFDHRFDDLDLPIKDQGIVKSPVRIGPDCWLGVKVSVLRGSVIGRGCVVAAHAVVRGDIPDRSVAAGVPARVLKDRSRKVVAAPGESMIEPP